MKDEQIPKVFLAAPNYGGVSPYTAVSAYSSSLGKTQVTIRFSDPLSILTYCFNLLYAEALNQRKKHGYQYFAMIHADMKLQPGWLDTMVGIMQEKDLDILSGVAAIKSGDGHTSTGVWNDSAKNIERISMKYVHTLPKTFGIEDITPRKDCTLCINTGVMLVNITKPWIDSVEMNNGVGSLIGVFENTDCIVRLPDGEYQARTLSEDWNYSLRVSRLGGRIMATREIKVEHMEGKLSHPNDVPWGTATADAPKIIET